jgi:FPC/CPF motif-containing protein YcgG
MPPCVAYLPVHHAPRDLSHPDDAVFGCGRRLAARSGPAVIAPLAGVPRDPQRPTDRDTRGGFVVGADEAVAAHSCEDAAAPALPHGNTQCGRFAASETQQARERFAAYVMDGDFPCVGARSALNRGRLRFSLFDTLGDPATSEPLCRALYGFMREFESPGTDPVSFVAAFRRGADTEEGFEALLWAQLQSLHEFDRQFFGWDPSVGSDPAQADFSFSLGGRGLFVVGLHPQASRIARRAPDATLVFNFHSQFEALRADGKYGGMQKAVRRRDLALQGSLNPSLALFGEASEALQYSGRAAAADWKCPFKPGTGA